MSTPEQLADTAAARLAESKPAILTCLRKACRAGHDFDAEFAWRFFERQVKCWAIEPEFEYRVQPSTTRRETATTIGDTAARLRQLLRAATDPRPHGGISDTGAELIAELIARNGEAAGVDDEFRKRELGWEDFARIMASLEALEAAAVAVAERHPPRSRGRQRGSGLLSPDRVELLGWAYQHVTGSDWLPEEGGSFVEFVQYVGAAIGLPDQYDVAEPIRRARPDYEPPPSRQKRTAGKQPPRAGG